MDASIESQMCDILYGPAPCPRCGRETRDASAGRVPQWRSCQCGWEGDRTETLSVADRERLGVLRAERRQRDAASAAMAQAEAQRRRDAADAAAERAAAATRAAWLASGAAGEHVARLRVYAATVTGPARGRYVRAADILDAQITARSLTP